ncbi:hypothetical protein L218DRAFT_873071 [Marasmius fiardii PR-910]|nr:hypothetical protein L218DRAFT_873071 [Marasmius fiardii PR-910]
MKHVEDSLDPSELDRTCSIAADSSVQTDFINNVEPSPPQDDLVRASFVDTSPLASAEHGGHALRVPEPNKELTAEYRQTGVRIGDVGILRDDGSFDFVFNVCCSANDPINQYGVPTDFQTLSWNGAKRRMSNIFRPGEPVLSRGAKKQALGVEGTASVPFSKDQGAVIIPPNGVDSVDCQDLAVFRNYAERHAVSWHSFVNEELGMEVENGTIYFVTGFDKTDCWENAVFSHNLKERTFGIIVNTGSLAGDDGRLHLSDSSLCEAYQSRCSPAHNLDRNQPLFVRHLYVHQLGPRFPRGTSSLSSSSVYSDLSVLNVAGDQYRVLGDFKRNGKKSAIENVSRPGEPLSNCDAETLGFEGTAPLEFGDPSPQYWMVQAQRLQPPAHTLRAQDPDCLRDAEAK